MTLRGSFWRLNLIPNYCWNINRDRSVVNEAPKNVKKTAIYTPLQTALRHDWGGWTKRQTKEVKPAILFSILGMFELPKGATISQSLLKQFGNINHCMGVFFPMKRVPARSLSRSLIL